MKKFEAIQMLGGTPASAALALGVTVQAINKWPDDLPLRIADRVRGDYLRSLGPTVLPDCRLSAPAEKGMGNA